MCVCVCVRIHKGIESDSLSTHNIIVSSFKKIITIICRKTYGEETRQSEKDRNEKVSIVMAAKSTTFSY